MSLPEPPAPTRRRIVWRTGLALLFLFVLAGGGAAAAGYLQLQRVFKGNAETVAAMQAPALAVDPSALKGEGSGRINILLIGHGGPGQPGGDLTNSMELLSIDPVNKKAATLALPADLWVNIPQYKAMKLNDAYAQAKYRAARAQPGDPAAAQAAGIANLEGIVSQVTGLPVNYYAMFDFAAFQQAIDTVGGVTINVPSDLYDPSLVRQNQGSPVVASKGMQTMHGYQAILYLRSRAEGSDFARSQRQQTVLTALANKIISAGTLADPLKLSALLNNFGGHFMTDLSIANTERLANIMKGISLSRIQSIGLSDPPHVLVSTAAVNRQSIVRPLAGFDNYQAIQSFVRNTLKDGYLAKENASVVVVSDTYHQAQAAAKLAELQSYGYRAVSGGVVSGSYDKTVLVDLSHGQLPYTRHYLESRLKTTAINQLPSAGLSRPGAQFVIIVGNVF